jgi:hypothetical protein
MKSAPLSDMEVDKLDTHISAVGGGPDYDLEKVKLSGGALSDLVATLKTFAPVDGNAGTFRLRVGMAGKVNFDHWYESGTETGSGAAMIKNPFDVDAGAWHFKLDDLELEFDLKIDKAKVEDLDLYLPPQNYWKVSILNATQQDFKVSGVKAPKDSVLTTNKWIKCIQKKINQELRKQIEEEQFSQMFVKAANTRLETFQDFGMLTTNIEFCFPPMELDWPASGGLQTAISGRVAYVVNKTPVDKFSEAGVPDITVLDVPQDTDFSLLITPYEIDGLLWGCRKSGDFNKSYDGKSTNDPSSFNTDSYRDSLPELYSFAPSEEFAITAKAASYDPNSTAQPASTAPTVGIEKTYVVTESILSMFAPADVQQALAPIINLFFESIGQLDNALKQYLTPPQYQLWAYDIEHTTAIPALVCRAGTHVSITMMHQGQQTSVFDGLLQLTILGANFTISVKEGKQILAFDFEVASHKLINVTTASGLTIKPENLSNWYRDILSRCVQDYVATFKPPGHDTAAIAIPNLDGFQLSKSSISIADSGMLVTGNLVIS